MMNFDSLYDEARGPSRVPRRAIQRPRFLEAAAPRDDWFYYRADWLRFCPQVPTADEWVNGDWRDVLRRDSDYGVNPVGYSGLPVAA